MGFRRVLSRVFFGVNMEIAKYLITIVVGYLLGSLSTSIFMSRTVWGSDVRKRGSGNAGATNMARIYGVTAGVLTFVGDALKAGVAMFIGWKLLGDAGIAAGGIAALVGHCFPCLHHFHGGKGVSVGAAIGVAVDWRVFVAIACAFFVGALLTKKVSVGSICAALMLTISSLVLDIQGPKMVLCVVGMCLVVFQHRENIRRLIKGTEPDFKAAKNLPSIRKGKKKDVQI